MDVHYNTGKALFVDSEIFINRVTLYQPTDYHAHNFIEIAFISEGEGIHHIAQNESPCKAGDIFVLNFDVPHRFLPLHEKPMVVYNCIFQPSFIDYSLVDSRCFSDVTNHFLLHAMVTEDQDTSWNLSATADKYTLVREIFQRMLHEFLQKEDGYIELLRAYLIELLVTLFRLLRHSGICSTRTHEQHQLLLKIMQHIEQNFQQDLSLHDLSMLAFLSTSHFSRMFKEFTGVTVTEFTQRIRIDEACRLLRASDKKIVEIALDVGYHDLKHFNALFKRVTGLSPSMYRTR